MEQAAEIPLLKPPLRRFRRFIYRNMGPPRVPGTFSFGCWLVQRWPQRIPFTKYASPEHYTFYIPRFRTRAYSRVMKGGLLRDFGLGGGPAAVTFAVTARCPCSCYHCSAYGRPRDGELDTSEAKEVIRQCVDLMVGSVVLTGGEPMARHDLAELISETDRLHAAPQVFTSGYYMERDRVRELARAGLQVAFVSLDSPDAATHDEGRGVDGLFERACAGLRYAAEEGISTGISTFATHDGVRERNVERFFQLGGELGVREITVFDVTPTGRMLGREDVMLTEEDHLHLCELQEGQFVREDGPKIVTMSYVNDPSIIGCFGARYQIHITHDGYVTPCDFMPLHFGNVREEPLARIWKRMRSHPEWSQGTVPCRMQDREFRRRYIDPIPGDAPLPYPIDRLR